MCRMFWRALGWYVENKQGLAQSLGEVQIESRVHIEGRNEPATACPVGQYTRWTLQALSDVRGTRPHQRWPKAQWFKDRLPAFLRRDGYHSRAAEIEEGETSVL